MNHIIRESIKSFKKDGESYSETKERVSEDSNLLAVIFDRVQNEFKDVKSLKRYIKGNKI